MPSRTLKPLRRGYQWFATRHGPVHVICRLTGPDGQVGYVGLDEHPDRVVLRSIHVFPYCRAKGFGTQMLGAILDAYGDLPIQLWCHPEPEDMPLNATQLATWYARLGFVPLPDRPEWMERAPGPAAREAGVDHQAGGNATGMSGPCTFGGHDEQGSPGLPGG